MKLFQPELELAFEDIKILVEFYEAGDESVAEELESSYANIKTDLNNFNKQVSSMYRFKPAGVNSNGVVKYVEHVPDIIQEPDYDKAIEVLKGI